MSKPVVVIVCRARVAITDEGVSVEDGYRYLSEFGIRHLIEALKEALIVYTQAEEVNP